MALQLKPSWMGKFGFSLFLFTGIFILSHSPAAADLSSSNETANQGPDKYAVFALKNISPQKGLELLAEANITNVSQLNDTNTLLISGKSKVLLKASALLSLVDSREEYAVKALLGADEANRMPSTDAMAAQIGRISIGTFYNEPGGNGYKAILDIHDDKLIAVAPAAVMDRFVEYSDIVKRSRPLTDVEEGLVSKTTQANPDKAFSELLDSLSKAESNLKSSNIAIKPATLTKTDSIESKPAKQISKDDKKISVKKEAENSHADDNEIAEPNIQEKNQYDPEYSVNADETVELQLPEKLKVIELLDLIGKYLNLNYVYDETKLKALEVNLKVQGPIKIKELYPLAESVLKFTKLVMTRKGNLVTIMPMDDILEIDPALIDTDSTKLKAGDVVVTRVFQLNYIDTASAKALLEGMKVGAVTEIPARGTLIVTGYAYRMARIEQLLEVVDKPGSPKQFKYRQLKYTLATTLAPKVKALVEQLGDITIAIGSPQTATPQPGARRIPNRAPQPQPVQATPASVGGTPAKSSVYLDADERTNRILMIGQEEEIEVVENLIDSLDVAQQDIRSIRVYEIQNIDAEDVRKKLEELGVIGPTRASSTTPGRITNRPSQVPGQPQAGPMPSPMPVSTASSDAELPTEEMQVVVLESTNSLMVNASPEQHALVANIISYVDSESEQKAIPYKVYPLQNQSPDHIAEVLKKLLEDVVRDKEGKVERVVKKTEDNIIVVPDPNTFSLIVYANKKNQDWVADLIKTLDKRRPQVLIDVTLVEITNTDTFNYDLQLATKIPEMAAGGGMEALKGGAIVSPFLKGSVKEAYSSPINGAAQAFYSDSHIQMLLTAMQSKNYGRVLAKPKILVNDGQVGKIETTQKTNVAVQNTVVPNQGSAVQSTSYQPYDAGIMLTIQPNISEGDLLLLIVKLERSDFLSRADVNVPPDTVSSKVDTIVTVPNSKTIILGGMLKLNQNKGGNKVPILGDIPLIGGLFRSANNSAIDSKLYVFVKANILRPEATLAGGLPELERESDRSRRAFEEQESRFQRHEDWPCIKPKPVDPWKVLEAE